MNKQEIIKENRLIAEFMGFKETVDEGGMFGEKRKAWISTIDEIATYSDGYIYETTDIFKSSWDELMPVVNKIENLDLSEQFYSWEKDGQTQYNFSSVNVDIDSRYVGIYIGLTLDQDLDIYSDSQLINGDSKLEATYKAVIEFIKFYNKLIKK